MSSDLRSYYEGGLVAVTGGSGFLASHLIEALTGCGARVRAIVSVPPTRPLPSVDYVVADLRRRDMADEAFVGADFAFHLAAVGWGLHENMRRQPELLTENVLLNTTSLDAAQRAGVQRYLYTSSSAVYPGDAEELDEVRDWDAPPHHSEASFGWAKRVGEIQARNYFEHYGFPVAIVRPTNPYGPRDNFDPERSHVIPALIRRAVAGEQPFIVWGSGRAVRSFIYAEDVARGMLLALMDAADCEPVNLGSPEAVSIAHVVRLVLRLAGRDDAKVKFDTSKPDGHPRKVPRIDRLRAIGLNHFTSLEDGLRQTIDWYQRSGVIAG